MKARHSRHYTRQAISVGIALAGMAWDANWHSNTLVSATGTETTTPTPLTTLPPPSTLSAPPGAVGAASSAAAVGSATLETPVVPLYDGARPSWAPR